MALASPVTLERSNPGNSVGNAANVLVTTVSGGYRSYFVRPDTRLFDFITAEELGPA